MIVAHLYRFATDIKPGSLPQAQATSEQIKTILSVLFAFLGAIALLVIVISGIRYIVSGGEPDKIAKAKNGIIYALVGLVLAIAAQSIVALVVKRVG